MGKFTFAGPAKRVAASGASSNGCVEKRELVLAPQVGLEPTTLRLTAECSTIELLRSNTSGSLHYIKAGSRSQFDRANRACDMKVGDCVFSFWWRYSLPSETLGVEVSMCLNLLQ